MMLAMSCILVNRCIDHAMIDLAFSVGSAPVQSASSSPNTKDPYTNIAFRKLSLKPSEDSLHLGGQHLDDLQVHYSFGGA